MKNLLLISVCLFFISCTSIDNEKCNNDNILAAKEVKASYPVKIDDNNFHYAPFEDLPNKIPSEWIKGVKKNEFCEMVFNQVLNKNAKVYYPTTSPPWFSDVESSSEKTQQFLDQKDEIDSGKYDGIKEILFFETWALSENLRSFTKKVNTWSPVQQFTIKKDQHVRRLMFYAKPEIEKKGELIAEKIFYMFEIANQGAMPNSFGLDHVRLVNTIFDRIITGELDVYDPIYMVDGSMVKFLRNELENYIGEDISSIQFRSQIHTVIFEENWYYDEETMCFQKEVLSMGFVKEYWDPEAKEAKSKIMFFIKF